MRNDEQPSIRSTKAQRALAAVIAAAALALTASTASAAVSVTGYQITSDMPAFPVTPSNGPSSFQAGGNPDAGSFTTFSYLNATEDLKTALTNFGPGLLGNPESVPKCPQAALEAGGATCPAGSAIGTSRLDTQVAAFGIPGPSLAGVLYNAELLGNEPGRLAAVTPLGGGTFLVSSIPFTITPRGNGDYGLTGTLTDINRLPAPPFPADLQVAALGFVITGSSNRYVRNPTSCVANVSTGEAIGYDDPTTVAGPSYTFTPTGCEQLPFDPKLTLQVGERGSTGFNKHPSVVVTITQATGEADMMGNKITLPSELNSNNSAYTLCSQTQADTDSCPDAARFGTVTAKSPFLADQLEGPVYLLEQGSSLPGLLLDLRGRAHVKIQTHTTLINNKAIQSLVLNSPQLPISEVKVVLNGGKTTGVFVNRRNLCFRSGSTTRFNTVVGQVKFYGWNGKQTADTNVNATVNGCGPAVKVRLKGAQKRRPRVTIATTKHPDAPNMSALRVSLSRNLTILRSKLPRGGRTSAGTLRYAGRHTLLVTALPSGGSGEVTIRLRRGAVKVGRHTKRLLNRGRKRRFAVRVSPTPVSGPGTATKTKIKVRGRRR